MPSSFNDGFNRPANWLGFKPIVKLKRPQTSNLLPGCRIAICKLIFASPGGRRKSPGSRWFENGAPYPAKTLALSRLRSHFAQLTSTRHRKNYATRMLTRLRRFFFNRRRRAKFLSEYEAFRRSGQPTKARFELREDDFLPCLDDNTTTTGF